LRSEKGNAKSVDAVKIGQQNVNIFAKNTKTAQSTPIFLKHAKFIHLMKKIRIGLARSTVDFIGIEKCIL